MSIPSNAKATPLDPLRAGVSYFHSDSGQATPEALLQHNNLRNYVQGGGRIFACVAAGTNLITLTPNGHGAEDGISPLLEDYVFGDGFLFWAAATSTGSVTATVVPKTGTLATLKVYKSNGATQAAANDVVLNSVYFLFYAPHLNANAGGLVLK